MIDTMGWTLAIAMAEGDPLARAAYRDYLRDRGVPDEIADAVVSAYLDIPNAAEWVRLTQQQLTDTLLVSHHDGSPLSLL